MRGTWFKGGADGMVGRGMVQLWFAPEKIKSMRPYIDKTVNKLLDQTISRGCANGPVDLVEEFALPVPSYVGSIHVTVGWHQTGDRCADTGRSSAPCLVFLFTISSS